MSFSGEGIPQVTYTTADETEAPSDVPADDKTTAIEIELEGTTISSTDDQYDTTIAPVEGDAEETTGSFVAGSNIDEEVTTESPTVDEEISTDPSVIEEEIATDSTAEQESETTSDDGKTDDPFETSPVTEDPSVTQASAVTDDTFATESPYVTSIFSETTVSPQEEKETEVTTNTPAAETTPLPALEFGECLKDGVVYQNGSEVTPGKCEESCVCEDGLLSCVKQACPPSPPAFLRCSPVEGEDQCCPTYDCCKYRFYYFN